MFHEWNKMTVVRNQFIWIWFRWKKGLNFISSNNCILIYSWKYYRVSFSRVMENKRSKYCNYIFKIKLKKSHPEFEFNFTVKSVYEDATLKTLSTVFSPLDTDIILFLPSNDLGAFECIVYGHVLHRLVQIGIFLLQRG